MKLTDHPFIQSIPDPHRLALAEEVEIIALKDQAVIFKQNAAAHSLYLILSGEVEFNKTRANGSTQIISRANAGNFFGEVGVFTGEKRALNAVACGRVVIGRMSKETLEKTTLSAEPTRKILESVISHLRRTTQHYMDEVVQREKLALVGTMLTSLLHDFKGPFSIISLGTHLISQRHKDDPKTVKSCQNIELQIQQMVNMVNDLAAFPHGENTISPRDLSLESLFENFRELKAPLFHDSRFTLELEANQVEMQGDSDKLLRAIQNLVSNAIEALPKNCDSGEIRVEAHAVDDMVHIQVKDNGPGIPHEIQGRFFEPFATFGKSSGSGLGTAITKSIVEAHHGKINFETSEKGTTIYIDIPLKQPV